MIVCQDLTSNLVVADSAIGLNNWLINAFNGEWLRTEDAIPLERIGATSQRR